MTSRLQDLDNFRPFMLEYMQGQNRYSAGKARITQTFQDSEKNLQFPFADIFLTTANMDMKLI